MFEGFASPPAALQWTGVITLAALIAGAAWHRGPWRAAVRWAALALAGQAWSLQLLWVGPRVRLQLFYGWSVLLHSLQGIFLLAILGQAAIVAWGARNLWPAAKSAVPRLLTWKQGLLFLPLAAYAAITIHPAVAQSFVGNGNLPREIVAGNGSFAHEVILYLSKAGLGLLVFGLGGLNLVLAVHAIPAEGWNRLTAVWNRINRERLPLLCAVWVVAVSSLLAWVVLDRMPHVPDEVVYLFEAKYFAAGHLYLSPVPASPQSLISEQQLIDAQRWYGAAPAGWPFVLAVGVRLGLPWLVNPLLGAIAIFLAHTLLRRVYDVETANIAVLLLSFSPWLLFLSASYMPHALSLVCALAALVGIERARNAGSIAWAAAAGLAIGLLLHVRALEAVVLAVVGGIWWMTAGWRKLRLAAVLTTCIVGLAMTAAYLAYNKALTGDPFQVPINKLTDLTYYKGANRLGFGRDVGNFGWTGLDALPGHGPIDVVMNTNQDFYLVNFEMFGWACGSLLFVLLLLVWFGWRGNELMWALVFVIWAAMSLYWFSGGPDFGARYWYQMIVPLAALTVRGAKALVEKLRGSGGDDHRIWAFVALATLVGFTNLVPWRSFDKYHNYRGMRPDIRQLERKYHFGRSLVFVRGPAWPDYASAFAFNPPTFDRDAPGPIFARDLGPEPNQRLRAYFSDRPVWIIAGQTETRAGLQVVSGPLPGERVAGGRHESTAQGVMK